MARNGVGVKGRRKRVKPREEDSDESDEEYKVTEDEECDESDECFSFDSDESEADFEVSRRVSKSRNTRRSSSSRKRNETIKSRKKRRIIYKEDDDEEEEEVDDEDDIDFMSLGRKANQIKKPAEKKRDSYTEVDDNDNDDDNDDDDDDEEEEEEEVFDEEDEELTSLGRKVNQIKKSTEKKEVSYTEVDDEEEDDHAEFAPTGKNRSYRKNRQENKRVVYTEDEDDEEGDDDDDTEFMFRRKRNSRNNPQEKKRVVYTEDDDEEEEEKDEEEDDVEFMYSGRKVNQKKNLREKRKVSYTEDDEDDLEFLSTSKKDNQIKEEHTEKTAVSFKDDNQEDEDENDAEFMISESEFLADEDDSEFMPTRGNRSLIEEPREKTTVSYKEDNQEEKEDEKDAEFKLSESDFDDDDDEDETPKTKKSEKISKSRPQKKSVRGRRGRKSKTSKSKKPTHSKHRNRWLGQKLDKNQIEKRTKKTSKRRRQSVVGESDSDFVSSASSDHEYTISEEEREQMREASVFCSNLRAKLRSSSNGNEEQPAYEQRKYPIRKGKEKVEEVKDEVGKQVCGICLSEEAKRTVRGVLNCCRHYFCFSCIIEWSKVESRCPLCKQRFATITKSAKSDTGFDLRTVIIPVPECDQVYQPSEEELRGYLDPYESVMCTECHNGGDDALMLLCDICDSSAHTFCVGLGREVPEGNWYCEGCRPTVFGTLNSQRPTPTSDRRLSGSGETDLSSPIAGGFDLNELYVPETPLTQQTRVVLEPMSAPNGTVATTLRDRRRIHRQIHHRLLNNNRLSDLVARSNGTSASSSSGIRLFGSQLDQTRGSTPQNDHIMPSMHDTRIFSSRTDQFGVEVENSNLVSVDGSLQDELGGLSMGFESRLGYAQLHPCTNRSSIGSDPCPSPYACREGIGPSRTSQGGLHAP